MADYGRGPQSFGYYRGAPLFGGQGSGYGVNMAGNSSYAPGQGPNLGTPSSGATPSVIYMVVLVIVEMFVFAWLSKHV